MSSEPTENKSKYSIPNSSSPSNHLLHSNIHKETNTTSNTSTDTDTKQKIESIAEFSIQSTTFKKRKKRSRSKQILKPSAPKQSPPNNNKPSLDDSNIIKDAQIQSRKRRKLNEANPNDFCSQNASPSSSITLRYISDRSVLPAGLEGQGAAVDVYVENTNDYVDNKPSITSDGHTRYKGLKSQRDTRSDKSKAIKKAPKFLGIGPQRAPDNVKITCRFDYQPDICKDWKETGFCGYGASCKFLHDRGDYKAGWQIERDWQKYQKKKNETQKEEEEENWEIHSSDDDGDCSVDEDGLPFACYICRNGFKNPVKTKCGHYFCSACAINQFRVSDACGVCGTKTGGSFQTATKLIKKFKKMKKKR